MSLHPEVPQNRTQAGWAVERPVTCNNCSSDRDIALSSIEALSPPSAVAVEVGYCCRACGRRYQHPADVAAVAAILSRGSSPTGVLSFAGHYIHCGQPMQKTGSELRRLSAPAFTDGSFEDALDVYLTTKVLHCRCGFQMELPE
jgi:hypothetical protein